MREADCELKTNDFDNNSQTCRHMLGARLASLQLERHHIEQMTRLLVANLVEHLRHCVQLDIVAAELQPFDDRRRVDNEHHRSFVVLHVDQTASNITAIATVALLRRRFVLSRAAFRNRNPIHFFSVRIAVAIESVK
jgi:hypothetical protein